MLKFLLVMGSCFLLTAPALTQGRPVTGKVTDAKGAGIANVSVLIKGSSRGTTTGVDGTFSLSVPNSARTLVFSSIGFTPLEVPIGKGSVVNATLTSAAEKELQDIVVVGYGSQRKADLTSSVTRVSGESVANIPLTSVDQILQGKAAGLQSTTFSGQPGANQQVRIRGIGSYSANTEPLYVIDGIQINSGDLGRALSVGTTNVLANINPNDIESISVLKDAAATSIYGARGANGVILITTKKGKPGKTVFNASAEAGGNRLGDVPAAAKPLNASDWLSLFKEGYINAGGTPAQAAAVAAGFGDGTVNTDWLKTVTRTGTQQQYNLSAQGGEGKTTFYVSGGYFKQEAATIGSDLTRISSLVKLENNPSPKLNFSLSLQPTYTKENAPLSNGSQFGNPILSSFFLRPTQNPYAPDGSLNISATSKDFSNIYNPLYIARNNVRSLGTFSGIGNVQARYSILDNLRFTTKIGLQYLTLNEYAYDNPLHGDGLASNGRATSSYNQFFLADWTNQLDYRFSITKDQDLVADVKLGYESILSKNYFITASAQNFPTPRLDLTTVASTPTAGNVNGSDYSFASVYSNLTLNYKGRYVLSGNFRRDGSSRFSSAHQYGNFPSVSVAWNMGKENFMSDQRLISDLKLRASYGASGNAEIGNYTQLQLFGFSSNVNTGTGYNGQPGGIFNSIGNGGLTWEKDKQSDIGFDVSLFGSRLNIIFDYYDKVSSDLLFSFPLSETVGFTGITRNIGKMTNKGQELTINANPLVFKNFSWDLSLNITHNKNTIDQLPPGQTQIVNGQFLVAPGYDINTWYMRQWAGVDPATGSPLWYTDASKSGTTSNYNAAARVNTGKTANPKYFGGFSNTFNYKGFSLSGDLYYSFGNYVWDQWALFLADQVNPTFGKYSLIGQRWQKPGDITNVPQLIYNSKNLSNQSSTRFLEKADYLRLRNITLGYRCNPEWAKRLHMSSLRIYVRATNLWTKTFASGLTIDPEQGGSSVFNGNNNGPSNVGINNLNVFYNKAVTAGVNIGF